MPGTESSTPSGKPDNMGVIIKFPPIDQMIEIDMAKLADLVAKTPFTMPEFERLIGWGFSMGDAPRWKRALAWQVLQLPQDDLQRLHDLQKLFPNLWVKGIENAVDLLPGSSNVVPIGRGETK